ncbi:MAG: hypothetical protein LUB59_04460 [Candidatus Gastranaerophilales bacterium]|nr:hypothetical protein [Candidatus Gastranaerophilales bacterium]
MGMSSSQARLLTLTGRMHDIEYKAARLEAQKLQMANESSRVYNEYLNALDATKIQYKSLTTDGSVTYFDATLNAMENGIITDYSGETSSETLFLQNQDGKIIVTPAVAAEYGLSESGDLGTLDEYLTGLGYSKTQIAHENLVTYTDYTSIASAAPVENYTSKTSDITSQSYSIDLSSINPTITESAITESSTATANASTTFAQLGITNTSYTILDEYYNSLSGSSLNTTSTINDLLTAINTSLQTQYGTSDTYASIENGVITIAEGAIDGNLATALGITTTTGTTQTSLSGSTTLGELDGATGSSYELVVLSSSVSDIDGTPYLISSAEDLANISSLTNSYSYFILTSDIDLSGTSFSSQSLSNATFDGNGHTISGLTTALFSSVSNSTIQNLNVSGNSTSQAILADSAGDGTTIQNITVSGSVNSTASSTGALVGSLSGSNITVTNCYSSADVTSTNSSSIGGLIGGGSGSSSSYIEITNCTATGTVTANGTSGTGVGGLVGSIGYCNFTNCTATGDVSSVATNTVGGYVGGLVGCYISGGTMLNCIASGDVTGTANTAHVGGLVGGSWTGENRITISNSTATGTVSGESRSTEQIIGYGGVNLSNTGDDADLSGLTLGATSSAYNNTNLISTLTFSSSTTLDELKSSISSYGSLSNSGTTSTISCSSYALYGSLMDNLYSSKSGTSYSANYTPSDETIITGASSSTLTYSETVTTGTKLTSSISKNDLAAILTDEIANTYSDTSEYSSIQSAISNLFSSLTNLELASLVYNLGNNSTSLINALTSAYSSGSISKSSISSYLNQYSDSAYSNDNVVFNSTDSYTSTVDESSIDYGNALHIPTISGIASNVYVALIEAGYSDVSLSDITSALTSKLGDDNDSNNLILANINKAAADYINGDTSYASDIASIYNYLINDAVLSITDNYSSGDYDISRDVSGTCSYTYGTYQVDEPTYTYEWDYTDSEIASAVAVWTMAQKGVIIATDEQAASTTWLTNMINTGEAVFTTFDPTQLSSLGTMTEEEILEMTDSEYEDMMGIVNTSVAVNTSLREVSDETNLKKAEAKYEADMKKIDRKDTKYDTDIAALETERSALTDEIETLKTVASDNVERTFKLFS